MPFSAGFHATTQPCTLTTHHSLLCTLPSETDYFNAGALDIVAPPSKISPRFSRPFTHAVASKFAPRWPIRLLYTNTSPCACLLASTAAVPAIIECIWRWYSTTYAVVYYEVPRGGALASRTNQRKQRPRNRPAKIWFVEGRSLC